MNDDYAECLIVGKKNMKAKVGKVALIVVAIGLCVAAFLMMQLWIVIIAIIVSAAAYWVSGYVKVEYEYLYIDKELSIDRIYNAEKRKRVATYPLSSMEIVAPINSYHLDKVGKLSDKAIDYAVGVEEKPDRRYVIFFENKQQLIFSPDEKMIKLMKNNAPRKVFTD